jgi:CO/xanthine dehydrogenase FAD-binding subunit
MDGTEADGIESAARNACQEAADDFGSAEYRMDVASTLAKRCLENI